MTEKDLSERHPDAESVEADLEDALALEASRTGTSTGEASAVLRTLPATTRRRLPLRLRLRVPAAALRRHAGRRRRHALPAAQRGRGAHPAGHRPGRDEAPRGEQIISVKRTSAHDYDPLGDGAEHAEQAPLAVDQDTDTAWTTESYRDEALTKPSGEPGVGLYIDAEPSRQRPLAADPDAAARLADGDLRRPRTPHRQVAERRLDQGRRRHGRRKRKQRFKLDTGDKRYRYYLVWITKLPPDEAQVGITQVTLSAPKPSTRRALRTRARALHAVALQGEPQEPVAASGHGTPVASHSFGNADVGVIPGSVLSSLTRTRPSSTKKSTRANPAQPTRRNVSTASRRTSSTAAGAIPAGTRNSTPPSAYLAS